MTSKRAGWIQLNGLAAAATALALGMATLHASASATELDATGSGWCSSDYCGNSDLNAISNHFAGDNYDGAGPYRDWFAFDLSSLAGQTITAAKLNIWSDGGNVVGSPGDVYSLYQAAGISYDGLMNGSVLGSITSGEVDDGTSHYVSIALNTAGLAALESTSSFIVGGDAPGTSQFFGYTTGAPLAQLEVESGPGSNVPEPASIALLGLGFLGMGVLGRKSKA